MHVQTLAILTLEMALRELWSDRDRDRNRAAAVPVVRAGTLLRAWLWDRLRKQYAAVSQLVQPLPEVLAEAPTSDSLSMAGTLILCRYLTRCLQPA